MTFELVSGEGHFESAPGLAWTTNRSGSAGSYFVPDSALAKIRVSLPGSTKSITYTVTGEEAVLRWIEPDVTLSQPLRSAIPLGVTVTDHKGAAILNETVKFRIVDAMGKPVPSPEHIAVFMTKVNTTELVPGLGVVAATTLVIDERAPLGEFYVQAYLPHLPSSNDLTRPVSIKRSVVVLAFDSQEEKVISGQGQRARGGQTTAQPMVAKFIGKPDLDPDTGEKIWPTLRFTIISGGGYLSLSSSSSSGPNSLTIKIAEDKLRARVYYTPGSPHHHPAFIKVETERKPRPPQPPGFIAFGTVFFTTRPAGVDLVRPVFKRDASGIYLRNVETGQPQEEGAGKQAHEQPAEPVAKPSFVYQVDMLGGDGKAIEPDHKGKVMIELRVPLKGLKRPPEKVLVRSLDFAHRIVPDGIGAAPARIEVELLPKPVRIEGDTAVYRTQPFIVTGDLLADSGTLVKTTPEQKYKLIYAPHKGFVQIGYAASPEIWLGKVKVLARLVVILAIDGLGMKGWRAYLNSKVANKDSQFWRHFAPKDKKLPEDRNKIVTAASTHNESVFPSVTFVNWACIFTGKQPVDLGLAGNEFLTRTAGKQPRKYWRHVNFTGGVFLKPRKIVLGRFGPDDLGKALDHEGHVNFIMGNQARTIYEDLAKVRKTSKGLSARKRAWVAASIFTRGVGRRRDWYDPRRSAGLWALWAIEDGKLGPLLDKDATVWVINRLSLEKRKNYPELITIYLPGLDHHLHESGNIAKETADYLANYIEKNFRILHHELAQQKFANHTAFILCSDHGHTEATVAPSKGITLDDFKPAFPARLKFTLLHKIGAINKSTGGIRHPKKGVRYAIVCHNGPVANVYLGAANGNAGFHGGLAKSFGAQRESRFDIAAAIQRNLGAKIDKDFILIWDPDSKGNKYRVLLNASKRLTLKASSWLKTNKRDINGATVDRRLAVLNPLNTGDLILHSRWDRYRMGSKRAADRTQFAARGLVDSKDPDMGQKWTSSRSNHGGLQKPDSETPLIVAFPGITTAIEPRKGLRSDVRKLLEQGTSNPDVAKIVRLMQKLEEKKKKKK